MPSPTLTLSVTLTLTLSLNLNVTLTLTLILILSKIVLTLIVTLLEVLDVSHCSMLEDVSALGKCPALQAYHNSDPSPWQLPRPVGLQH